MAFFIKEFIQIDVPMYFFRQHDGVRINSQYYDKSGIGPGFLALDAIEKTLNSKGYKDTGVSIEITKFYITLATLSARNNSLSDLRCAEFLPGDVRANGAGNNSTTERATFLLCIRAHFRRGRAAIPHLCIPDSVSESGVARGDRGAHYGIALGRLYGRDILDRQ